MYCLCSASVGRGGRDHHYAFENGFIKTHFAVHPQVPKCQGQTLNHYDSLFLKFLQVKQIISALENDAVSNNPSPIKKEIHFVPLSFI